ncbi:pre-mRNA-splicing factor SYF1 [Microbotryum lychnidis-dioicae p1A1 Lamole]|uniref:Pre-mRNA-splicing factor SYF1 n=1 Tax=Microbotryum lychnidis-dioicae (strain p1A1 Lamole / MvSl-1064) TaxID=683840 RepID=U5H864_USTV1|nr:pre-mRNA-splicing factor SYF1 [Microbotryum lychnidis-dioicae p1A1 Lamole]|eukprot:KDE06272.1 pre-mRNA-splicing factor SYF1 [Microbotryum lychnidis-dioicae p1A1 Lamole]
MVSTTTSSPIHEEGPTLSLESLRQHLPLTSPIPTFATHPSLLDLANDATEHDLARNPSLLTKWTQYIQLTTEQVDAALLSARGTHDNPLEVDVLGYKLSSAQGRLGLQRLTDLYERALKHHPTSYSLWKAYLKQRSSFVLGRATHQVKLGTTKKARVQPDGRQGRSVVEFLQAGKGTVEELEQGERDVDAGWQGALDGVVGYEEWISLAAVHERALMWLPLMPRIWLSYLTLFLHPKCPSTLSHTHARRTFDRALRTLPSTLHDRIWKIYLDWAQNVVGGETAVRVWRRYLKCDPAPTAYYVQILLNLSPPRPLEASKLLLNLFQRAQNNEYKDPDGKSAYQLLGEWLEVCEKFPEEVGIELEESLKKEKERTKQAAAEDKKEGENAQETTVATVPLKTQRNGRGPGLSGFSDAPLDPLSLDLIDVEYYVRSAGLNIYLDQAGRLWTGLATYWIKRGEFDHARAIFEEGISTVVTLRDFTQIFDAYAEFSESYISGLMESLDEDEDEKELDMRMVEFEKLMDRRPFLVNDVLLRRNPHDVQEWEKRVALHGDDDEAIAQTYNRAIKAIAPRKATTHFHTLWIHFAKFYEQGGSEGHSEKDLEGARKILEKATQVPFKKVDELAEIWCEWAEMEVRNENYDEAIKVMQRATTIPKKWKEISFHDEKLSPQARLFKSIKLWSFYVDLEESIGSVESTKAVYDQIFELKIATAQIVINYANFLEENQYWEESFKVYERGVDLFTYPIAFEIWNAYLSKFIKRYGGDKIERARDLFEQALQDCPVKFTKPLFLLYGQLEEEHGLAKRAMAVYDRATRAVESKDRMEMFTYYIAKATANFGLPATRPIYERAIEQLPDRQTAQMCLRFAALERKLGEIDRARAIFAHASQFCDPRVEPEFWNAWNTFEIETGSEDTFREYLRIKRAVQAAFNTEASYLAAKLQQVQQGGQKAIEAVHGGVEVDPMAALDAATGHAQVSAATLTGFVKASGSGSGLKGNTEEPDGAEVPPTGNQDEIVVDDDDDDEEEEEEEEGDDE